MRPRKGHDIMAVSKKFRWTDEKGESLEVDIGADSKNVSVNGQSLDEALDTKADKQTATGGFVGGKKAAETSGGVAIGNYASATSGAAVGSEATATSGMAGGYHAESTGQGAALGNSSHAYHGGAVGNAAQAGNGFAGGNNAKCGTGSNGADIDCIQLGAGTNGVEKTLKIYDHTLMNADGSIPAERLGSVAHKGVVDPDYAEENNITEAGLYVLYGDLEVRTDVFITHILHFEPDIEHNWNFHTQYGFAGSEIWYRYKSSDGAWSAWQKVGANIVYSDTSVKIGTWKNGAPIMRLYVDISDVKNSDYVYIGDVNQRVYFDIDSYLMDFGMGSGAYKVLSVELMLNDNEDNYCYKPVCYLGKGAYFSYGDNTECYSQVEAFGGSIIGHIDVIKVS